MFSATGSFRMSTNPFQSSWLGCALACVCASLYVCVCDCQCFPGWQGQQELVRGRQWSEGWQGWLLQGWGNPPPSPPLPSITAAGGCVCPRPTLLPWALLTLITPFLAELTGGFPGRRRLPLPNIPLPPCCSFPQWISRATMKQKLVASPFFTQPGVRGWPFTPGDSED